jgi:hypothetical protein
LSSSAATQSFDVTADGKQIVFDRVRENSDVVLIDLHDEAPRRLSGCARNSPPEESTVFTRVLNRVRSIGAPGIWTNRIKVLSESP